MRLFKVRPDDSERGPLNSYEIDATHEWGLPGMRCPACGQTWATTGLAFPAVDLSGVPSAEKYRGGRPVAPDELEELRRPLRPLLPEGFVPPPGTEFGPLVGRARGPFPDFVWVNPWTLLLGSEALTRLQAAGLRLPAGVAPRLTFRSGESAELLELQLEPAGVLAEESFNASAASTCPACGREGRKPERIVLEPLSAPGGLDIFRVRNFPTLIVAAGRLADAVRELRLTGVVFDEVEQTPAHHPCDRHYS